jgi:hypothetical protein
MGCGPTCCRLAAPPAKDRNDVCLILTCKMAPISGPRSGVGYSGVLGRESWQRGWVNRL